MKLAVVGSRDFSNYELMKEALDKLNITYIVSGGARGADSYSELYAKQSNIETIIFKPDWERFGKSAGYIRNQQIVEECDYLIAFWDKKSRGTKHSIDLAEKQGKLLRVVLYDK